MSLWIIAPSFTPGYSVQDLGENRPVSAKLCKTVTFWSVDVAEVGVFLNIVGSQNPRIKACTF